jgi:SAM-dependent methyltransferase
MTETEGRYLVDGRYLTAEEVRAVFNDGVVDLARLDSRERVALRMVEDVARTGRLLDVGCYAGMFASAVAARCPQAEVHGVDYFADNVRMARLLHPALAERFRQMSVYRLEFPDASFDCATFKEVIEHIHRPVDALREINRVLKAGGHLIVTTPNANADAWRLFLAGARNFARRALGRPRGPGHEIFFENVEWNRHICAWTASTLNTLLLSNGYEYVGHEFYCNTTMQRLFPEMGAGLAFLVRKTGPAPTYVI